MKRFLRYSSLALAIIFVIWFAGLAVIYFAIDIKDVKNTALSLINENINGEFNVGAIELKLFPVVHFKVNDLVLRSSKNFQRKKLFSCRSTNLSFSLISLILGKPSVRLKLNKPILNFIASNKTNNLRDILKKSAKPSKPSKISPKISSGVTAYLFVSKISFNVDSAQVHYRSPSSYYKIEGLNLDLELDPVSRDIDLRMVVPVDINQSNVRFKGDINVSSIAKILSEDEIDLTVSVDVPDVFVISAKGKVVNFLEANPYVDFDLSSKPIKISELNNVIPFLSSYNLSGELLLAQTKIKGKLFPLPLVSSEIKYSDSSSKNNINIRVNNTPKNLSSMNLKVYSSYMNLTPFIKNLIIKDLIANAVLDKNKVSINKLNLNILDGQISSSFTMSTHGKIPAYSGKIKMSNLKLKEAINVFMPELKGAAEGVISGNLDYSTSGYTALSMKRGFIASGFFSFTDFIYYAEGINKALTEMLGSKLGRGLSLEGKRMWGKDVGWEKAQASFNVRDEKINVSSLTAKDKEYELKGKGVVGFDKYMDMHLEIITPYRDMPYEAIKLESGDKSSLPIHVLGPILRPKLDVPFTLKYLAGRTFQYEKKKLETSLRKKVEAFKKEKKAKVKAEVKRVISEPVKEKAKEEVERVGEKLKETFKGFRF